MKRLFGAVSAFVLLTDPSANGQAFLTDGLVAYYPLNGNFNDATGQANNGVGNNVIFTSDWQGNPNSAGYFNGVDSYIQASASGLPSADRTVTLWVYPASVDVGRCILGYGGNASFLMLMNNQDRGQNQYETQGHYGLNRLDGPMGTNAVGYWHQFAVTVLGSHITMFIDASTVAEGDVFSVPTGVAGMDLIIGTDVNPSGSGPYPGDANGTWFNGGLGKVRIYNRALSASEIQELYVYESNGRCAPHSAAATATLAGGSVVGAILSDGGCGYTNTPLVLIQGGGGAGSTATATMTNGVVTGVNITAGGTGYTNAPNIYFYSPLGFQVGLVKAVKPSFVNLCPPFSYQLQVSTDLSTWTNQGIPFTATSTNMVYPEYFDVDNWGQLFFRLQVAP